MPEKGPILNISSFAPIPNIIGGILIAFLAILGIRITYPLADAILDLFQLGAMRTVAILAMWLIYFFVLWILVWMRLFQPHITEGGNK